MIDLSKISGDEYLTNKPFPHIVVDNALPFDIAKCCQEEILNLDDSYWKHLTSPFEDKMITQIGVGKKIPKTCAQLYNFLESETFCNKLSELCSFKVEVDETRLWSSIHKYKASGGYLDIHCDAGVHPITNKTKTLTIGIYFSKNWRIENGGQLELWNGDSVMLPKPILYGNKPVKYVDPLFNRMVIFTNTDKAWHGNPNTIVNDNDDFARIFLTMSYVSNTTTLNNKRNKAFFVPRPFDVWNEEKRNMAILRADSAYYRELVKCKDIEK